MSEQIVETLHFPDNVRRRPGMYIGSLHNPTVILRELVDNFKDEGLSGYATKGVVLTRDTFCVVADDGRGVPIYIKSDTGNTAAVDIWSQMHTGGKFDDDGDSATIGMNGIGSKATNALSNVFIGYVNLMKKDLNSDQFPVHDWIREQASNFINPVYRIEFNKGILVSESVIDACDIDEHSRESIKDMGVTFGTIVYFEPDETIWTSTITNFNTDSLRVSMLYLEGKMEITVNGESAKPYSLTDRYYSSNFINVDGSKFWTIIGDASDSESGAVCKYHLQLGFSGEDFDQRYDGSVNTVSTPSGCHVDAASRGIARAISQLSNGQLGQGECYHSIRLFTLVMTNRAIFDSQTKERLASINGYNMNVMQRHVLQSVIDMYANDKLFRKLIDTVIARLVEYKKQLGNMSITEQVASEIIVGSDYRNSILRNSKVKDCNTTDRSKAELFIVEGDSAAGSLCQGRDRSIHAVMPLRGKSLNATGASIDALLENDEFKSLFNVIGAGIHPYNVDMEACRYGKVIITADADADGSHICALLLGAFGTHLPQLIEEGRLYIAESPLYEQDGEFFLASERHLLDENKHIVRNKGLGGLDPDDIATFVFSDRRVLRQVTPEGLEEAISLVRNSDDKYFMAVEMGLVEA